MPQVPTTIPTLPGPPSPAPKTPSQIRAEARAQRAAINASRRQQIADNRAAIIAARQTRRLEFINSPVGITQQRNPSTSFNTDELVRGILGKALDAFGGQDIGAPNRQVTPKPASNDTSSSNVGLILLVAGGGFLLYWLFFK